MSRWKVIDDVSLYFITTTIVDWKNVFVSVRMFDSIIESLSYCMANKGLHVHGYVIMPTHVHYIVSSEPPKRLSGIMRDFGRYTSQRIVALLDEMGCYDILESFRNAAGKEGRGNLHKVWQTGFHPIAIMTETFFLEKLNYIHQNPVRKGFVEQPEYWKYSSARNYILDDHSIIKVECLQ